MLSVTGKCFLLIFHGMSDRALVISDKLISLDSLENMRIKTG